MNKTNTFIIYICIALFLGISQATALSPGEKDIVPPKTVTAPVIDGKIEEQLWKEAYHINNFENPHQPVAADTQTEVFLCYDDNFLYLAIKCHEPDIEKLKKCKFAVKRDDTVYADDCVQIFLDVNHDHFSCFQFNINPIGTQEDFLINNFAWKLPVKEWDGIWQSATYIGKDYWSAEFVIPFYTLNISSGNIDIIGFNVARTKKVFPSENSCWTCTYGGFHNYSKYGHLRDLKINMPPIAIRETDWGKNKWGENNVSFNASNTGTDKWHGDFILLLKDLNGKELGNSIKNMVIDPGNPESVSIGYRCRIPGKYIAILGIASENDKIFKPLFSWPLVIPPALDVNVADLIIYENENAHIPMHLNTNNIDGYEVGIKIIKGNQLIKNIQMRPEGFKINTVISTAGLVPGEYMLDIELRMKAELVEKQKRTLKIIDNF